MIRTGNFAMDERALELGTQCRGNQKVINAPANVALARAAHRAPPGVMPAAALEFAERVNEASLHKGIEPGAFLDGETVVTDIRLGVREIYLGMRDLEVAAKDDRFPALELF